MNREQYISQRLREEREGTKKVNDDTNTNTKDKEEKNDDYEIRLDLIYNNKEDK